MQHICSTVQNVMYNSLHKQLYSNGMCHNMYMFKYTVQLMSLTIISVNEKCTTWA